MVRIQRPVSRDESRESARIVILRADDPDTRELLDWARFHSPFPDRWDPTQEGRLAERMAEVTATLEERSAYEARLRPRLVEALEWELPGLMDDDPLARMSLGNRKGPPSPVALKLPVEVLSVGVSELAERWGVRTLEWDTENAKSLLGRSARFVVGVAPAGAVEFCLLEKGISEVVDPQLERWLRDQELAPDAEAEEISWGVVRLQFQPQAGEEAPND